MEIIVRDLVREGDYFAKIDLMDAYLSVPLSENDRKYLQFAWNGKCYQFRTLCFGLSIAPWAFTKLIKPIAAHLRSRGLRLIVYLDDILIINETKLGAEADFSIVKEVLERAGFVVNGEKSVDIADQTIEFLGTRINSVTQMLTLKESKLKHIRDLVDSASRSKVITLRSLAKILGNLSWAVQAVPYAQAHFRSLQATFNEQYHFRGQAMETEIPLNPDSLADLMWWRDHITDCPGKRLEELKPDIVIYSDASLDGWGATMNGACANGPWSSEQSGKHINELELLAAFYALRAFANRASNVTIHVMLDNATSVAYINKCGGTHSAPLRNLALKIISWCEQRRVYLQAFHVPGKQNFIADYQSHFYTDSSDWKLNPLAFARIHKLWPVTIDLFASSWNRQLDCFVSWRHQPDSQAVDAFSLNWKSMKGYLFPPFCLIPRCLSKIRWDEATVTLVTPFWPTQAWFPLAVELVCDSPRMIQWSSDMLTGPHGEPHPLLNQESFRLIAWRLSGSATQHERFRIMCPTYYSEVFEAGRQRLTNQPGDAGDVGVSNNRAIPLLHL